MEEKYINALRSLGAQMIKNAKSGHTGMMISAAPIFYTLFCYHLRIAKEDSKWCNRDRFVLSAGHGSAGLYAILHFAGLIDLKTIQQFRHGNEDVAGHPEHSLKNFIDASTGPLGQGIANAVGMAIAEKYLQNRWKELNNLINHYTYVLIGDGDLQEGICYESMSLAGKLCLNKLIVLHDSNDFQLDSSVQDVNIENIKLRVESQGWRYFTCDNRPHSIDECIIKAKQSDKPSFIEVKTIIGEGTSKQKSFKAHGLAIDDREMELLNNYYDMNFDHWNFNQEIYDHFSQAIVARGNLNYQHWNLMVNDYLKSKRFLTKEFLSTMHNQFVDYTNWLNLEEIEKQNDATKTYLKTFFNQLKNAKDIITLSADLASTTNCKISNGNESFNNNINSGYVMVGIREFAMGAIQNGILLHGGLKVFAGTFLVFSDYIKPAIRVGALSKIPANYILTHDSYLVGPDGPTHQPYDQIPMLRAIDNVYVWRPCDEKETYACLSIMLNASNNTNCLVLTRQKTVSLIETAINKSYRGAYILNDEIDADITLIASGSEVELAIEVARELYTIFHIKAKIVSCPGLKHFLKQDETYIQKTLSSDLGVVSIEASSDCFWYHLSPYCSRMTCIQASKFGFSDNGEKIYKTMGFDKDEIVEKIKRFINGKNI